MGVISDIFRKIFVGDTKPSETVVVTPTPTPAAEPTPPTVTAKPVEPIAPPKAEEIKTEVERVVNKTAKPKKQAVKKPVAAKAAKPAKAGAKKAKT